MYHNFIRNPLNENFTAITKFKTTEDRKLDKMLKSCKKETTPQLEKWMRELESAIEIHISLQKVMKEFIQNNTHFLVK